MIPIFNLLSNILITGTSIIGSITIVNKIGKFCKVIEENNDDGFKIAFDTCMMDTIDDMNKCVDALGMIANNFNNIIFVMYDIFTGNKFIKKNKEGKIIICNKSKVFSGYKDKIDELSNKVKKYQEELKKIKKPKEKINDDNSMNSSIPTLCSKNSDTNSSDSSNSDSDSDKSDSYSEISEISETSENNIKKDKKDKKEDDYYLET
jgi:hypothetical protein